jgi:hypothetical protein
MWNGKNPKFSKYDSKTFLAMHNYLNKNEGSLFVKPGVITIKGLTLASNKAPVIEKHKSPISDTIISLGYDFQVIKQINARTNTPQEQVAVQPAATPVTPVTPVVTTQPTDAKADIEKRRQEELIIPNTNVSLYDSVKKLEKGIERITNKITELEKKGKGIIANQITGVTSLSGLATDRKRLKDIREKELQKIDKINAKYDAELAALEQPTPAVGLLDGLEVVAAKSVDSPNLVTTIPTVFANSNAVVQSSIMRTISQSLESFNLKVIDMFSFIRETLGESAMLTLENTYNNVTEALKTNDIETIARLKQEYLAVFSGSTFAKEQLEYIWKEQYVKGKPDASIPFQDLAYVTNGQFATAYQGDEVIVTAVKKETGEVFTYNATVTGKLNESNQIEVKTRNGNIVYIKKSDLQTIAPRTISVRANFNQTNSIMMTAVTKTTGEIAKFNSNGERDAQGDTQLNTFVPQANPTMIEVRKSLASGQPVAYTLPIHAGARINSAFAYKKGKTSVYLTAAVGSSVKPIESTTTASINSITENIPELGGANSQSTLNVLSSLGIDINSELGRTSLGNGDKTADSINPKPCT